jgi:hypothetical protein
MNNDFRFDLKRGQNYENKLADILKMDTIEVKTDFQACFTGNIAIEYESRGKPSGIATSEASHYCYMLTDNLEGQNILISTEKLKKKCRWFWKNGRTTTGGDDYTSKLILIPLSEFFKH